MLVLCFLQIKIWSGSSCSRLRGGGNRNTKSNTSLSQGACASEVCAQPLSGKEDNDSDQTPVSVDKLSETEGHGASDSRSTCSSDTIPSAHPPGHNGNRSDDSTDLLEGGGKKSKSWVLQPCPKPVNKHSKWLNIGDCLGLFTAEELIQGEHSLCERCAEVQRMHEINSQDEGEVTRVCVETAKTICYFAHLFHQFGCVIYNFPVTCSLRTSCYEILRRLC